MTVKYESGYVASDYDIQYHYTLASILLMELSVHELKKLHEDLPLSPFTVSQFYDATNFEYEELPHFCTRIAEILDIKGIGFLQNELDDIFKELEEHDVDVDEKTEERINELTAELEVEGNGLYIYIDHRALPKNDKNYELAREDISEAINQIGISIDAYHQEVIPVGEGTLYAFSIDHMNGIQDGFHAFTVAMSSIFYLLKEEAAAA